MGVVKQIDIKNQTYYFYNDMINIKHFDPIFLKIDRKSYKCWYLQHWIYYNLKTWWLWKYLHCKSFVFAC